MLTDSNGDKSLNRDEVIKSIWTQLNKNYSKQMKEGNDAWTTATKDDKGGVDLKMATKILNGAGHNVTDAQVQPYFDLYAKDGSMDKAAWASAVVDVNLCDVDIETRLK